MGVRVEGEHVGRTPERVARAWAEELVAGYRIDPARELTWTTAEPGGGPIAVRGIGVASVCAHHLLPFFGQAHVGYLPGTRLAGLSKLGRVVDALARRLQTQERLGEEIVRTLQTVLEPRGALVLIEAEHTCMTLRGVREPRSRMITIAASGAYRDDPIARAEVLELLHRGADPATSPG
jgi:GTP cyclohydrolase I